MTKFTRIEVAQIMHHTGLVPLFYHPDYEVASKVLEACYDGGARVLEFTSRGDFAHEVFNKLSKFVAAELPEMALGVGSVTDAASASLYMQMGAAFVVTPVLREDIARVCNRRKVLWSPGCGSLSEIARAEELGCELVKLFPGGTYGPGFVKAIRGPQPWTNIMPTGGVEPTEASLKAWMDAGAFCVGMGSKLITKELVKAEQYTQIQQHVTQALNLIKQLR